MFEMISGSENPKNKGAWRNDQFAVSELLQHYGWFIIVGVALVASAILPRLAWLKGKTIPTVVIYTSQDQEYAEPILRNFAKESGIQVKPVYDSEAVKTVGLANRLLAERSHPQCDVFWNNEELRTRQLAAQNVFRETNAWAAFGYRSRRIVVNTNFVWLSGTTPVPSQEGSTASLRAPSSSPPGRGQGWAAPRSLIELTNACWRGKIALAYPLFGTTATHFLALRQHWGEPLWQDWCHALAANQPFLVDGNSVVVKLVGTGEALIGLTDSDDIAAGRREGLPVAALPLSEESLLMANTVAVVRPTPHPQAAQRLFEYLQRREVAEALRNANALDDVRVGDAATATLKVDWEKLLAGLERGTVALKQIFLR
jgi:iron(III) transport system substrate-binding protein